MMVTSDLSLEVLKPAQAPQDTFEAAKRLDAILGCADTAGIDLGDQYREARSRLDRVHSVRRAFEQGKPDLEVEAGRLARSLVLGELDLDEAAHEAARIEARTTGLLEKAVRRTASTATTLAWRAAGEAIDADRVLADARGVSDRSVAAIRELRSTLEGVTNAEEAAAAGSKVAGAWATYREHLDTWNGAHNLVVLLRDEHWISPLPVPFQDNRNGDQRRMHHRGSPNRPFGRRYEFPDRLGDAKRNAKAVDAEFLHLLDPVCDEAEPVAPPTVNEEIERWKRRAERTG
jgi:hypothetical protein